jgi:hypothetical protein
MIMNANQCSFQTLRNVRFAVGVLSLLLMTVPARAQSLSPDERNRLRDMIGNRIEAATILGGDFGVSGASFNSTSGNNDDTLDLQKFGGSGVVGDPMPLGTLPIGWQPQVQGSMGYLTSHQNFNNPAQTNLVGAESKVHDFSIQFGGGAAFWLSDSFSIAPTIMGMYGHTENTFYPNGNSNAANLQQQAKDAGLVDWTADTWTIRPSLEFQYAYTWRRTIITLYTVPTYFHTESFSTSNPNVSVNGDSETWMNKIDVDIPTGKTLFGHELRTGGYFSRTDFYGDMKNGLPTDYLYETHGRLGLDYLNQLWKVQWIGIGGSYLWGRSFDGWSIGADVAFRF